MSFKKIALAAVVVLLLGATAGWFSLDKQTRGLIKTLPTNNKILFYTVEQRDAAFRALDKISLLADWNVIPASQNPRPLPKGEPLELGLDLDAYMAGQRSAAIVIVHDGKVRLERYGLDFDGDGRWTSFSVAKSFTSTLVGAAVKDGYIKSLDDKVTDYIPRMKGSPYEDVSVRQLLTMTSGVRWNEDYDDPKSDVALFLNHKPEKGDDALVSYMSKLERAVPPGTRWHYSTGETNLIGILVNQATKRPLAQYLSEKVWGPVGMAREATWTLNSTGNEISGCCIQAATRDFAHFGQFVLDGAVVNGESIVPDGWFAEATTNQAESDEVIPGLGYGFQWWTYKTGEFAARGIFGQGIFIDPERKLVIASNANWGNGAMDRVALEAREAFYRAVQDAVDAEALDDEILDAAAEDEDKLTDEDYEGLEGDAAVQGDEAP